MEGGCETGAGGHEDVGGQAGGGGGEGGGGQTGARGHEGATSKTTEDRIFCCAGAQLDGLCVSLSLSLSLSHVSRVVFDPAHSMLD